MSMTPQNIRFTLLCILLFNSHVLLAQHEGHDMSQHNAPMDPSKHSMSHAFSLNLPMSRNSSGTAWQPDATSMYGYMLMTKKWDLMFHGSVFIRYNYQDVLKNASRAESLTDRIDAPNWFMMMAQRKVKQRGLFAFSAMLSLDELVMTEDGYPLLFQSGETFEGKPLVDRQHPHDLFSGLSAAYTHMINQNTDITLYVGYPGEPALGPPAFMHRISTFNNPDAPLSHHWQDASHINFGVATIGIRYQIIKAEFSAFTGREPDENRYDFDKPRFDSYSYRLSVNPTENFSIQVSQGFIKSPEALESDENITRSTASIMHSIVLGEKRHLSTSLIWGMNQKTEHKPEHSVLLESNLQLNKTAVYGRYELIQKSAHELVLPQFEDETFWINAITFGSNYNIVSVLNTNLKIGAQATLNVAPHDLEPYYGRVPLSLQAYLRLTPINMNAHAKKHKKQNGSPHQ